MQQKNDIYIDTLHIFVLFSFALAQPLFDLLSRNAEFFVAHHCEPVDIILLILIVCVLLPGLVVLIEVVTGLIGRRARKAVHGLLVAGLVAVIVLPALKKIGDIPGTVILICAGVVGVVFALGYIKIKPIKTLITFLLPGLLLFPTLFLFNSPVYKVVFPKKVQLPLGGPKISTDIEIIMVIFDEFTSISLMDEHRQIDPIRYPNFAALARDAYWFRNTTTVALSTADAVPAILTGLYPPMKKDILPIVSDYPHNLFTFLNRFYRMNVVEHGTRLCPQQLGSETRAILRKRLNSLLSDIFTVYLHIILPPRFSAELPDVTKTWKGFARKNRAGIEKDIRKDKHRTSDRVQLFKKFIHSIRLAENNKPTLNFMHVLLPHMPYEFLPSGKMYGSYPIEGLSGDSWTNDEFVVSKGYQRYLLQLGYADKLLGELLTRLKNIGIYDRSLIIITADHGNNFQASDSRRGLTKKSFPYIISVPLFIKLPNQKKGVISDRNVETIDISPTIAETLGVSLPWPVDGQSVFNTSLPERPNKTVIHKKKYTYGPTLEGKFDALNRKLAIFGSGAKTDGLFKIGRYNELVGHHTSKFKVLRKRNIKVEIYQSYFLANVDPQAKYVPCYITGRVLMRVTPTVPINIAISVNDTIRAVTSTSQSERGKMKFSAIVPEKSFHLGGNDVHVFLVSTGGDGQLQLERPETLFSVRYSLTTSKDEKEVIILSSDGKKIPVIHGRLKGRLDKTIVRHDAVSFKGWSFDVRNSQLPEAILIFANGEFLYSGQNNRNRPDVEKAYGKAALQSGFSFTLPLTLFKDLNNSNVSLFAVSKNGVASELNYHKEYEWRKK